MSTTIATYYIDELMNWSDSINFYNEEMEVLEQKLNEVIRRNSIVGIAEKVEVHMQQLNLASEKFYKLLMHIQEQEEVLVTDDTLVEDYAINNEIEMEQTNMRKKMKEAEKEYIDIKFDCYTFLSSILKK